MAKATLVAFREIGLWTEAFLATLDFTALVFLVGFLVALLRTATFGLAVFRATLLATARFALGRLVFVVAVRRLSAAFGEDRRAAARDVERLGPFVTALMKLQIERVKWSQALRRCTGRIT